MTEEDFKRKVNQVDPSSIAGNISGYRSITRALILIARCIHENRKQEPIDHAEWQTTTSNPSQR